MSLVQDKVPFVVSVLGEQFGEVPEEFAKYKEILADHIVHWGYAESRDEYFKVLGTSYLLSWRRIPQILNECVI